MSGRKGDGGLGKGMAKGKIGTQQLQHLHSFNSACLVSLFFSTTTTTMFVVVGSLLVSFHFIFFL